MTNTAKPRWLLFFIAMATAMPLGLFAMDAESVIEKSGVTGGLAVILGDDKADLAAELAGKGAFRVQFFTHDPEKVEAARKRFRAKGMLDRASVHRLEGDRLPYAEEMVNLLVVADDLGIPRTELERVLVPGGVLFMSKDGKPWTKPVPEALDDWTHWQHDAGKSGVSNDTRVGPPRRMKWVVGPRYGRGHEYVTTVGALLSAGGRLFYVIDEGQTGNYELPTRCVLICRDAYNGLELWRKPVPHWYKKVAKGGFAFLFQPERMATDGKHIFIAMKSDQRLTALDAASGQVVKSFDNITGVEQILIKDGLMAVMAQSSQSKDQRRVLAMRIPTWKMLWDKRISDILPAFSRGATINAGLTFDGKRVFLQQNNDLLALDVEDGKTLWNFPLGEISRAAKWQLRWMKQLPAIVRSAEGKVLISAGQRFFALNPQNGEVIWKVDDMRGWHWFLFFAIGDTLYNTKEYQRYNLSTGELQGKIDTSSIFSEGHHPRCYPPKATVKYLITNNRGAEFISIVGGEHAANDYLRGNCGHGVAPANGLLYIPPNPCFCYGGVMQPGFKAMAPADEQAKKDMAPNSPERLTKGPAFNFQASSVNLDPGNEWPMYRGGPARLGSTQTSIPEQLEETWTFEAGGQLTPPVAAGNLVLFANKDTREVIALDMKSGREMWRFAAEAVVDSPPVIHEGRILFGSADGHVYCLRASDGALAWKFLAAPRHRWVQSFGHIQSAWPVSGSVLVKDGVVYATAGINTWIDGGIHAYGLDPKTGEVVHYRHLKDNCGAKQPEPDEKKPFIPAYHIEGARNDLLVAGPDSDDLFLGPLRLNKDLSLQDTPYQKPGDVKDMDLTRAPFVDVEQFRKPTKREGGDPHKAGGHAKGPLGDKDMGQRRIFATGGLLDDTLWNRTYWMFAKVWPGYYKANLAAKAGQLLVADTNRTYAARYYNSGYNKHSPYFKPGTKGVLLYADANDNEPVLDDRARGRDKGYGWSRQKPPLWHHWIPVLVNAMVATKDKLFVAGPPDILPHDDPYKAYEGRAGAVLQVYDKQSGDKHAETTLNYAPVFDGMIAADGKLFISRQDGRITCLGSKPSKSNSNQNQ